MVQVTTIMRALLVAAVAVSASSSSGVYADDAATQTQTQPEVQAVDAVDAAVCVAPDVVAQLETKLESLESERSKWQSQLVAASGAWKSEKAELEAQLQQQQQLQQKATVSVAKAQKDAAASVETLQKQLEDSEKQHALAQEELTKQTQALTATVEELATQVAKLKDALGKKDGEVTDAKSKLAKFQDQVKTLERDVASSRKKNEALRVELAKMDDKLSISSLLSSYYDEGVVVAGQAVTALRQQLESAQESTAGVTQALEALETYKKSVTETTDKLYAEHLAATIDPIIADLRAAAEPHVKKYQPVVEAEFSKAKKMAMKTYKQTLKRAQAARADAITLLQQQNADVAPYAQRIVDGSLVVLTAPIVFVLARLVLSLTWFVIRTTLCIVTLGFCCGAKKRSKAKRKVSRKSLPPTASASADATPSTTSNSKKNNASPSSNHNNNSGKRSGNKKQK